MVKCVLGSVVWMWSVRSCKKLRVMLKTRPAGGGAIVSCAYMWYVGRLLKVVEDNPLRGGEDDGRRLERE